MNSPRKSKARPVLRAALLAVLGMAVVGAAVAAGLAVPGPGGSPAQTNGILDIREVRSPGGVTAWLVEDHNLPVIAMTFAFKGAGAALDPADKQGLSTLASNTMDEGAGEYDSQSFQKLLADNSIALSFGASRDDFSGNLKTLVRHKELAFRLMGLALTQPRFDAEAVDRMRAANIARVRNAVSDPDWIAARIMNDTAFAGHPYAYNSGGTLTTLAALTPDDLRTFAKTRLARKNLVVTVAGAITAADLEAVLDQVFGALPATADLPKVPDLTVQNGGKHVYYKMDIPQTIIEMMQPGIGRGDPDFHAAAVMDFILGGSGFGSRLTEEIREKRGLTYGVHTGFQMMDHLKAYTLSTSTRSVAAAEIAGIVEAEWKRMRDEPVTDKELADAKAYLIGSLPLGLSSTENIAGILLGLRLDGLPMDYLDTRTEKINAVTAADVQRVAQRMLTPGNLTVVTVGGYPEKLTPTTTLETLPHVD